MSQQVSVLIRMRDVGFALGAADTHDQRVNRIQLQKLIYLVDVVSFMYRIVPPRRGHLTYKYGPYDADIQNAVDALAFRGLVRILGAKRSPDGSISAEYGLASAGYSWIKQMLSTGAFVTRWEATLDVAQKVDALGWNRLVSLVYAEPTFVSTKPHGYGQILEPSNGLKNSAAFVMATMDQTLQHGFEDAHPDRALIIDLFFRYLSEYDLLGSSHSPSFTR